MNSSASTMKVVKFWLTNHLRYLYSIEPKYCVISYTNLLMVYEILHSLLLRSYESMIISGDHFSWYLAPSHSNNDAFLEGGKRNLFENWEPWKLNLHTNTHSVLSNTTSTWQKHYEFTDDINKGLYTVNLQVVTLFIQVFLSASAKSFWKVNKPGTMPLGVTSGDLNGIQLMCDLN